MYQCICIIIVKTCLGYFRKLPKMPNSHSNSVMEVTLGSVVKTLLQNSCYRAQPNSSPSKSSWEDFCYQVEVGGEGRGGVNIYI